MKDRCLSFLLPLLTLCLLLGATACSDDNDVDSGTVADTGTVDHAATDQAAGDVAADQAAADSDGPDYAPENAAFGSAELVVAETGGPTNTWTFSSTGPTGQATLAGVDDFDYTYDKTGKNASTLIFDVEGDDKYEMVWTSATGGTFQESFDGVPGNPGTFTYTPQ